MLIDCTPYYNPEKDRRLRLHLGRHPDNLGEIVASDDYAKVNAPLKNLDPEGKNLIINVCKSGRHRAVANEESQLNPVQTILYGVKWPSPDGTGDLAEGLDLQAETHWGHMCPSNCEKCRRCNPENELSFNKAFEILRKIIPSPVSFHWRPSASAAAPPAPWKKRHKKPEEPLDIYVDENDEEVTAEVINKLLSVFEPDTSIRRSTETGRAADGRDDLKKHLRTLQKRYEIDTEVIGRMYRAECVRTVYGTVKGAPKRHDNRSRSPGRKSQPSTLPDKARSSRAGRKRTLPSEDYDITEIDLTKDHDPSEEHHSDEEVPYTGKHGNCLRTDLPETCDWGGPVRGDDNDVHFLVDQRRNRSRSPRAEASPEQDSPERGRSRTKRPSSVFARVITKTKGKKKGELRTGHSPSDNSSRGKGS